MVLEHANAGVTLVEAIRLSPTADAGARFEVRARPRARASRIVAVREGALVVDVAAPPVDGSANEELVDLLARVLSVPRRNVELVRGSSARVKLVEVRGLSIDDLRARLEAAMR